MVPVTEIGSSLAIRFGVASRPSIARSPARRVSAALGPNGLAWAGQCAFPGLKASGEFGCAPHPAPPPRIRLEERGTARPASFAPEHPGPLSECGRRVTGVADGWFGAWVLMDGAVKQRRDSLHPKRMLGGEGTGRGSVEIYFLDELH